MKKLTQTQLKKFLTFLTDNKYLVGMQGWTIVLNDKLTSGDDFATCVPNIYEQTLTIDLNEEFMDLENDRQESVMIHELVHGRIDVFKKIVEELTEYEEERLANDLERGFYALYCENKE